MTKAIAVAKEKKRTGRGEKEEEKEEEASAGRKRKAFRAMRGSSSPQRPTRPARERISSSQRVGAAIQPLRMGEEGRISGSRHAVCHESYDPAAKKSRRR